jgi:hypothetical protein
MHTEDRIPIFVVQLPEDLVTQDSGVVDEHVHAARTSDRRRDDAFDLARGSHVNGDRDRSDRVGGPGQVILIAVDGHHVGAGTGERRGECETDAARRARDDDGAIAEVESGVGHRCPPVPEW